MPLRRLLPLLLALALGAASAEGDLSMRLYQAHVRGDTAPQLSLAESALPSLVAARLSKFNAQWSQLSGLLQRAVLWDTGFVFASPSKLVQIQTSCQRTMADINMDISLVRALVSNASDCDILRCGMNNHFVVKECATDLLAASAQCAVVAADLEGVDAMEGVVWAEDGQNSGVADPVLRVHAAKSAGGVENNLYAIHLTDEAFVGSASCKTRGDFIIPCRDRRDNDVDICPVESGATVDAWLALVTAPQPSEFSVSAMVVVAVLSAMVCALAALVWFMYKHRQSHAGQYPMHPHDHPHQHHLLKSTTLNSMDVFEAHARAEGGGDADESLSNDALCSKSQVLKRFVTDPTVITKRIAFSQLNFLRVLSKGANGEVWLGQFESRYVAVKCLLPTKRKDVRALEQFSDEIRLASMLEHPRIVSFCGIAWHSLTTLSIVTEYMEKGDLENFLAQPSAEALVWPKEKLALAKDVADALVYLHSLVPVVIHRDLKSKNILLDHTCRAKLSDFGLSRETSSDETMTNGVGTILWSAPEVLEGKRYDEKADIFSYGIVLSEIDTCALPYGFNKDKSRNKMKSMQIVHLVAEGKLLPTFRDDCPPPIVELARCCLDLDPAKRPSAMQVVHTLRSQVYPLLHKQASSSVGASS